MTHKYNVRLPFRLIVLAGGVEPPRLPATDRKVGVCLPVPPREQIVVPSEGLEPSRFYPASFKPAASSIPATRAYKTERPGYPGLSGGENGFPIWPPPLHRPKPEKTYREEMCFFRGIAASVGKRASLAARTSGRSRTATFR